jgi:TolB-like protein/predicted Ser/Thr protein kinase
MNTWSPGGAVGPYTLLSLIGRGGMGEVWKAHDARLGRTVAIKRLLSVSESFTREARAIAALNHPHICTIHDVGDGYFVMEFVDGQPLAGPLDSNATILLARQIAAALEAAHAKGIVHCDLKPANVIVSGGRAKLVDFGIARLRSESGGDATMTGGNIAGTPAYMAPEQAQGQRADARSDIFSFGALVYELLSGRRAFGRESVAETLSAVLRDRPAPLAAPERLTRVIDRCLEKSPTARFQSATELLRALEGVTSAVETAAPSIAVLPFANMSSDPEQEYFSDGLTEEIINALAQLSGVKVIARTSSFAFKGKNVDIREIAAALGVTTILEGSVRKGGNRIRVTAQLINVVDGSHLWSDRYDRELADVFAVQDDIAAAICRELKVKLAPAARLRRDYKPRLEAYEAYLLARHHQWNLTPTSLEDARAAYERAIAFDPSYALPYTGLAELSHILATHRGPEAQRHRLRIRELTERALAIDPELPEGHGWLGALAATYDYDWAEADRRFRIATGLDARLRHWNAYFHLRFVRPDEAVTEHQTVLIEDPLSRIGRAGYVISLISAGRMTEARDESRRLLDTAPDFAGTYTLLAFDLVNASLQEALDFAERGYERAPWSPGTTGLLAGLLQRSGDEARSAALMEPYRDPGIYGHPVDHALFHLASGDVDAAVPWVDRTLEQHHPFGMMILIGGPYGHALRASKGWPVLAARVNLPR